MLRGSQPRGASIGLAVVVTLLAVDAAAAAAPVLGSPDYVANGGGFGTSAPSALSAAPRAAS